MLRIRLYIYDKIIISCHIFRSYGVGACVSDYIKDRKMKKEKLIRLFTEALFWI